MAFARGRLRPDRSLVGFRIGTVAYAIPVHAVRGISQPLPITALPHAPRAVSGVANHRGEIIPVIDLRTRFGMAPSDDPRRCKWVVVTIEDRLVGLQVDQVTDVFGTDGEALRAPPELGGGERQRGIAGVTTNDGELVFVLDVASFRELVAAADAAAGGSR